MTSRPLSATDHRSLITAHFALQPLLIAFCAISAACSSPQDQYRPPGVLDTENRYGNRQAQPANETPAPATGQNSTAVPGVPVPFSAAQPQETEAERSRRIYQEMRSGVQKPTEPEKAAPASAEPLDEPDEAPLSPTPPIRATDPGLRPLPQR